ncbi:ParB/RepB/Spo0J family partition protein [Pseudoroseomonas cervicalis]|uniref:ParB/RepB/Spo0J family partition protein n=1 Tax=Teichococcus cervicalis TaxID=204525 RepID=UPI00277F16A3|nr:ParB/RepB/Spo0J family partition protein [Pseudoroseomonas cervicalis]MDQ1077515.1 ParB family chromosome partitioning protein [Pseudoroseomonas cervicalis]
MSRARNRPASPVLGAAMSVIGAAAEGLVPQDSRFRHSFEAPLERIHPDPDQPRKHFDAAEIAALAATMAAEGQLQPVLLRRHPERRGEWILVAGERRYRAAKHNGWSSLLAIEHEGDAALAALLENLQRQDLTPEEEARGLQRLLATRGMTQVAAASLLGRSTAEISATLRLLTLPEDFLSRAVTLPRNLLVELARLEDGPLREKLLRQAEAGTLTVRGLRAARSAPALPALSSEPASGRPSTARLGAALFDRMEAALEQRHAEETPLSAAERRRLLALRAQIEALLEA